MDYELLFSLTSLRYSDCQSNKALSTLRIFLSGKCTKLVSIFLNYWRTKQMRKTLFQGHPKVALTPCSYLFPYADRMITTLFCMVIVQITFCPTSAKYFREEVVFVCDNCHVKEFSLEGKKEKSIRSAQLFPRSRDV